MSENKCTPANSCLAVIYLFKVNNGNTRKWCEICSKFNNKNTRMTSFCAFIVNFEHISHLF